MPVEIVVRDTLDGLARAAALEVVHCVRSVLANQPRCCVALSGGNTPWLMLSHLVDSGPDLPWERVDVFQVDERVAPDGDPVRNVTHLSERLPQAANLHPMPVTDADLDGAAARYARMLPLRFDLVHLGLGDDGHTASLVPGDPVLDVTDADVAVTAPYRGHRRMTLTFRMIDRAREVLWLATGADKAPMLARLLARDPAIPASRVATRRQVLFADTAAAAELSTGPPD